MGTRSSQAPPRLWLRHALLAAAALGAGALALLAYETGALNGLERQTVDARFAIRGAQPPGGGVVIVGVDQRTLSAIGARPPIPRGEYAQALDRLRAAHPRLIAIDAQFIGATNPRDDGALLAAIARDGPILLATQDSVDGTLPVPANVPGARGAVLGSAAVDTDPDNVLRRMIYAAVRLKTFAVVAAELLQGRPVDPNRFPANHAWVDFKGPPGTFPAYSLIDVIDGRVPAAKLAGRTVLVGVTDPVGKDVFVTSASSTPMSGVEFQANALSTILDGFPLQPASDGLEIVLLFVLAAVPAVLSLRLSGLSALIAAVGVLLVFLVAAQLAFDSGTIVSIPDAILALALGTVGSVAAESYVQRRQLRDLQAVLHLLPGPSDFFVSYRRGQSELAANTLREGLARKFGDDHVFMDTDAIHPGEQWPRRIVEAIEACRAMLVVIGPQWVEARGSSGERRLDDPEDWVRREIEAGLRSEQIVVVPVLHDGAGEPGRDQLPDSLGPLADCQSVQLTGRDVDRWIEDLAQRIQKGRMRGLGPLGRSASEQPSTPA
ncbi:MAG TPA: CHASE2 domain-containing protein [Solirubrobacteraceae bacterium]|nr:CHASE2 domain-containing protein [Solirubrobacteraceae bacterium]